jgi:hypothetical protein
MTWEEYIAEIERRILEALAAAPDGLPGHAILLAGLRQRELALGLEILIARGWVRQAEDQPGLYLLTAEAAKN